MTKKVQKNKKRPKIRPKKKTKKERPQKNTKTKGPKKQKDQCICQPSNDKD